MWFWIKCDSKEGCGRKKKGTLYLEYILESDVQSRTMAGALSENAPRPISVVAVSGATIDNARSNQLNRSQVRKLQLFFINFVKIRKIH